MRSFEEGLNMIIKEEIIKSLESLKSKYSEYSYNLDWNVCAPIVMNTEKEAIQVEKLAKEFFGEDKAGIFHLPVKASEDFAFFTRKTPGVFFFLGSGRDFSGKKKKTYF